MIDLKIKVNWVSGLNAVKFDKIVVWASPKGGNLAYAGWNSPLVPPKSELLLNLEYFIPQHANRAVSSLLQFQQSSLADSTHSMKIGMGREQVYLYSS